jgi:hypothetical protein
MVVVSAASRFRGAARIVLARGCDGEQFLGAAGTTTSQRQPYKLSIHSPIIARGDWIVPANLLHAWRAARAALLFGLIVMCNCMNQF